MSRRRSKSAPQAGVSGAGSESEANLAVLLDALGAGVLLESADQHVLYTNQTLVQLFELASSDSIVGLPIVEAIGLLAARLAQPDTLPWQTPDSQSWLLASGQVVQLTRRPLPAPTGGRLWEFRDVSSVPAARSDSMIQDAPVILFALDSAGTVTSIEGRLTTPGTQRETYLHRNIIIVLHELGLTSLVEPIRHALAGEDVFTTFEAATGTFDIRMSSVRAADGSVERVLGIVYDSSARQKTEDTLRQHNAYLETLHQTTLDLVNRLDLDHLLQGIVERAAALLGSHHGYIYLVEPGEQRIVVRYGSGVFRQYIGFNMARGEGIAGKVWESGAPMVVDEYDAWAGRSPNFDRNTIHAVVCVPLRINHQVAGLIGVSVVDQPHRFSNEEVQLLSQFGELASLALENARLYRSAQDEIAERVRTEQALRESEARYRSVVAAMGEGILVINADGVITDINPTAERLFGSSRSRIVGRRADFFDLRLTRPDGTIYRGSEYPAFVALATGEPQYGVMMGLRHEDGRMTWMSVNAQPILNDDGSPAAVVTSFSNVTEQKQAQTQLQRRIDILAALQKIDVELSRSLDIDYVLNTALTQTIGAVTANGGFIATLEETTPRTVHASSGATTPVDEVLQQWQERGLWSQLLSVRQPIVLEDSPAADAARSEVGPNDPVQVILPLFSQDRLIGVLSLECDRECASKETLSFLELVGARISAAIDNARLFQVSQTQLAELRGVYTQLKQLEQLKTQMIRVAAHDIRSPLGVIAGYITIMRDDMGAQGEPYQPFFESIFRAVERMEQMTGDILSLERIHATDEQSYERLSLADLVERAYTDHYDAAMMKHLTYQSDRAGDDFMVYGDPVQVYEAIANLISNAIKYTPENGSVTLRLSRQGESALFEVEDTGFGIPLDMQDQLFQPFYRVKTDDTRTIDGTGLGLYLVKGIVEQHNGQMHFTSQPGQGSTFGFTLPLLTETP